MEVSTLLLGDFPKFFTVTFVFILLFLLYFPPYSLVIGLACRQVS